MIESLHPFFKKSELRITTNYSDITIVATAIKIYTALFLNRIELEVGKVFFQNKTVYKKD